MVFYVLYLFVPSEFVFFFFLLPGVTAYGLEGAVQSGRVNACGWKGSAPGYVGDSVGSRE